MISKVVDDMNQSEPAIDIPCSVILGVQTAGCHAPVIVIELPPCVDPAVLGVTTYDDPMVAEKRSAKTASQNEDMATFRAQRWKCLKLRRGSKM